MGAFTTPSPRSPAAAGRERGRPRAGFTLIEMMVAVSIIVILVGMLAGAAAAARTGQRRYKAAADIAKLDVVIQQHLAWCQSLRLPGAGGRTQLVTQRISGDMPDNWNDVATLAATLNSPAARAGLSGPQRTYAGIWRALVAAGREPSSTVADAECLYMIITRGGLADCLTCSDADGIGIGGFAAPTGSSSDCRADNITNFDLEARQ